MNSLCVLPLPTSPSVFVPQSLVLSPTPTSHNPSSLQSFPFHLIESPLISLISEAHMLLLSLISSICILSSPQLALVAASPLRPALLRLLGILLTVVPHHPLASCLRPQSCLLPLTLNQALSLSPSVFVSSLFFFTAASLSLCG